MASAPGMMTRKTIGVLGCGWLGLALAKSLHDDGYSVFGSTTHSEKTTSLKQQGIEPFLLQFSPDVDGQRWREFFSAEIIVICIPPNRKAGLTDMYLQQLQDIVRCCEEGNVEGIVFISSTSVYPDVNREVLEDDVGLSSYLVRAEALIRQSSIASTILRFGGLVGPGRHPGKFLAGKKDVAGANVPVNLIHQRDCINIIKKIIVLDAWGNTFNACADVHPTKIEFYHHVAGLLSLERPQFSEKHSDFKIVNSQKLKSALDYQFIFPNPMTMNFD